ncbi:hypothetical protein DCAR_0519204 [Daucus carota subsp. sativus]|uniref:NAC domain-containing protein n=1 Tax=Daucus carota subsp. sativus TaxID=79200 RepID=A0AAF0X3Q0_DAUCS|nr:PREDICTED: protein CUP-SHAPED COTYLEDON 3-like isoform X2 [Daucus carota subsp. sativus]WOG99848.1 hypothetical protein DCAR_0519204 [Daucus carota subsp. sativus]
MLAIEDIVSELRGGGDVNEQGMPPGFRFHPTDEELITFYLASKVYNASSLSALHISEVDLTRCEPWELPDVAKMGEREWYLYSLRDRKYPSGLRTNRATGAGYWKATGKDKEVYSSSTGNSGNAAPALVGMKKTLVFYKGRAPRGEKTKWVMHEYRLDGHFSCRHTCKEEWVICRIYLKLGEKKNGVLPVEERSSYMQEASNSSLSHLVDQTIKTGPALQPYKTLLQSLQNQNQLNMSHITHESHLKSLINNQSSVGAVVPQFQTNSLVLNGLQTSFSSPTETKDKQDPKLLNTLLSSHQDYYCFNKQEAPPFAKICKTEPNFLHFHLPHSNDHPQTPKFQPLLPTNHTENPLVFTNLDGANCRFSDCDMSMALSSSCSEVVALNRASFKQMLLDPPTNIAAAAESWPFHF